MYKYICVNCGKSFATKSKMRKYCSKKCKIEAIKRKREENDQICYTCKNATGGCLWSKYFLPIKGWDADPTIIKDSEIGEIPSFKIKSCPNYIFG